MIHRDVKPANIYVCCVVYWLMPGRQVFEGSGFLEVISKHLHESNLFSVMRSPLKLGSDKSIRPRGLGPKYGHTGWSRLRRRRSHVSEESVWLHERT